MVSSFIGTLILSILMIIKGFMGVMPEFNAIRDLATAVGSNSMAVGWLLHFVLGTFVWGFIFAFLVDYLKGFYWLRGLEFAFLLWLGMMIVFMPIAGNGFFAAHLGGPTVVASLVLHLIFGFVLGLCYRLLTKKTHSSQ